MSNGITWTARPEPSTISNRHPRHSSELVGVWARSSSTASKAETTAAWMLDTTRYCQLGAEEAKRPRAQPSRPDTSADEGNTGRSAPGIKSAIPGHTVLTGGKAMATELEVVMDRAMRGEELLGMPD